MESSPAPEPRSFLRGSAALLIAVGVVAGLLVEFPAYRWFMLISLAIGIVVAGILYFWNKHVPVKAEEVHNTKRPLGLD
jgi:tetrahydromethanopterin S-methyltransferase subunit E